MNTRECALRMAVQQLLPYAESRVEDMLDEDADCPFAGLEGTP